jgi:hypothetical protein
MYSIRRQLTVALFAVTVAAIASAKVLAQSGPVSAPQPDAAPMQQQPNRITFTKENLPQLFKQLGFTVTDKTTPNGAYWQIVTQADGWSFTVQVIPMMNQDKISCLLLSSDLGKKVNPQAAQDLLKVMQWNHQGAYLMYFGYNAQTGCITAQRPYVFNDGSVDEMRQLFQDYFKTIRDTHVLWNAPSSAPAAAPVSTGTLTPISPAPAKPAPAAAEPANVAGTTWTGNENLPGFGKLSFVFRAGGAATMIDTNGNTEGTWTQNGNDVTINFQGCVYQGRINGQTLSGSGRITSGAQSGQTWSFQVALQKN